MNLKRLVFTIIAAILGREIVSHPEDGKPHTDVDMEQPLSIYPRRSTAYGIVELVSFSVLENGKLVTYTQERFVGE